MDTQGYLISSILHPSEVTALPAYIQRIPWQDGFTIGRGNGVDALTGYLAPSAVLPFEVKLSTAKRSRESFQLLVNESDLETEISANVGVALNIGQIGSSFGGSSTLRSKAKVSATSFSILGLYTASFEPFDLAQCYEMTSEAIDFAETSPGQFRDRYGDYFVAGGERSSTFTALLTYSSTDGLSLQSFSARMRGRLHELFTAEGSANWARSASDASIEVEVDVEMQGYETDGTPTPSAPWDTSKVVEALSWFKDHEVGVYRTAHLQHYNTLNFKLPRTIKIHSDAFGKIRRLHYLLSTLAVLAGSCPEHEDRSALRRKVVILRQDVEARQEQLAMDTRTQYFLDNGEELLQSLQTLHRRYRFITDVQARVSTQPAIRIVASKNLHHWTYGYAKYLPDSTIKIESTSQRLTAPSTLTVFRREGTLTYSTPESDRLIVGWEVISHRVDGSNGSWRRLSSNVLLDTSGSITFRSWGSRATDWEFVTYHVDASLFNFSSVSSPLNSPNALRAQFSTNSPSYNYFLGPQNLDSHA